MVSFKSIAITSILAASAFAAPTELDARTGTKGSSGQCRPVGPTRTIVANYDDLRFTESPANAIGTYKDLKYDNFFVDQYDGFIHPSSGKQTAISYDSTKPRVISVAANGDSFNLKSVALGCSSGYPQNDCIIKIRGNNADGVTYIQQTYTYPKLDNTKPFEMKKFTFDANWSNLKNIEFLSATIDGTGLYTGLLVDDLTYEKRRCV